MLKTIRNKKKLAILEVIKNSGIELTPIQIFNKVKQKMSMSAPTVRKYLRDLLDSGHIVQPYSGSYCNYITHGMMIAPLRTHNITLSVDAPYLKSLEKIADFEEFTGNVKIFIQFGNQRRKITGKISCSAGMDLNTIQFAINHFYDVIEGKTNHAVDKIKVSTHELNRDFKGVRIDGGIKCYTRKELEGLLFRIYQKDLNTVRVEQKVSVDVSVDQLINTLSGGLPQSGVLQGLFLLGKSHEKLLVAQKFSNRKAMDTDGRLETIDRKLETIDEKLETPKKEAIPSCLSVMLDGKHGESN